MDYKKIEHAVSGNYCKIDNEILITNVLPDWHKIC